MSWILNHKKKFLAFVAFLIGMGLFTLIYLRLHLDRRFLFFIYLAEVILIFLNEAVSRKIWRAYDPFSTFSKIRNVDYLIIGDLCTPEKYIPEGKTYVQISAPNRGFRSAYQILRHTHSILKEDEGTVVLPCGRSKKEFLLFDIPFLHPVTIKKFHLNRLKRMSKFPILFAPFASIKFLFENASSYKYITVQDIDPELIAFCKERNYSLQCFKKQ